MSGDYSRKTFKSNHNYSGVLMQQGRVQLDADWNEQVEINLRRQRAETVDTIGRAVVPRETLDGFKVELNAGELSIFPGRMYVDGLLAENYGSSDLNNPVEYSSVLDEEHGPLPLLYNQQPYFTNAEEIEPLPTSGAGIAYIDVWQREVTYVKQPDLVEPAVGIDTTARWQTVWQVKVLPVQIIQGENLDCIDQLSDWDNIVAPSAARLSTEIVNAEEDEDVCLVPTEGGYRALENRLYRVEVHDDGAFNQATFKWSRHNASIETIVNQISGLELSVEQAQWDAIRRFNVGDWVEVIDDVREFSGVAGEMRLVDDVDYAQNKITLNSGLSATDFPTDLNNATLPARHTRIRKWDQKNNINTTTGLTTITNQPFYLEDGIQISFSIDSSPELSGDFKVGDYWLFYARSAIADIEKLDQAPPRGIHHHYARLAVLNFPGDQDDCRIHWPPEFAGAGCCTLTVGDGKTSHGQYNSIQEAINQLPGKGGKICLLAGTYQQHFEIRGKTGVIISGCGERTQLIAMDESSRLQEPVILIENSNNIRIESLSIAANNEGEGIHIQELPLDSTTVPPVSIENHSIELTDLSISAGESSAIRCDMATDINIDHCRINMRDVSTEWPGIFVIGTQVLIEKNTVFATQSSFVEPGTSPVAGAVNESTEQIVAARGGIQIGGESKQVRVINNTIKNGIGDGITLGSLSLVESDAANGNEIVILGLLAYAYKAVLPCDPCSPPPINIPPFYTDGDNPDGLPNPPTIVSAGPLTDIIIDNNRIEGMGRSGIGVVGFFDLEEVDEFISVDNLTISRNHILSCLNRTLFAIDATLEDDMGYGGIALADVLNLKIHNNDIANNGSNPLDPVCGIYVLHGEGVEICDNRIIENGEKFPEASSAKKGARSGIHLVYAIAPTLSLSSDNPAEIYPRQNGVPAAKIHNNIVSHPVGRALTINALGPVVVSDNQMTSRGVVTGQASAIASTVAILNLGISNEFYLQLITFTQIAKGQVNLESAANGINEITATEASFAREGLDDFILGRYLANGNVQFINNQVVLDELDTLNKLALSAVTILSLDDIAFQGNQCDYSLGPGQDFLIFPNFIFAPSVRVSDNRFKESLFGGLISALSIGILNTTTDNQSTHCLFAVGSPGLRVIKNNIELWDALLGGNENLSCNRIRSVISKVFKLGDRL